MKLTNNPIAYVAAIAAATLLAGCSGGGGGSSTPPPPNQTSISGKVFQSDGTTPLSGATVALDGNAAETGTTDVTGAYTITVTPSVTAGTHSLVIEISSGGSLAPIFTRQIQVNSRTLTGVNVTVPATLPPPPPP